MKRFERVRNFAENFVSILTDGIGIIAAVCAIILAFFVGLSTLTVSLAEGRFVFALIAAQGLEAVWATVIAYVASVLVGTLVISTID